MKILFVIFLVLPIISIAQQQDLTGTWRLKQSKVFKGPDYTNAVPLFITIDQKPDSIVFEITSNNGEGDTVILESLFYGKKGINEGLTKSGRKKIVSFQRKSDDGSWIKQTEVFSKEDPGKLQSINKERYTLLENGAMLHFFRMYDGSDDPNGNQDFIAEGKFEKVTKEQLAKETTMGKGVMFTEGLTWEQIRAKAKAENKLIFVDCYATWCRPCKVMDKYIYPLNIVGEAMNGQFIAVKVQMDSTKKDPDYVKRLYPLARKLEKEYGIAALPSYLFFSPDGEALHKSIGQQDAKGFIEILDNAKNPEHQLYTLFNKAKTKRLPYSEYPELARRFKEEFQAKELATEIAAIYNKEYLNKLSEKELLVKPHLDFVGEYHSIVHSSDKIFQLSLKNPELVDSIKQYPGGGWADILVKRTVTREEIQPLYQEAERLNLEPNWIKLENQLTGKYNKEFAITYVLDARIDWYEKKDNWYSFFQYLRPHLSRQDLRSINQKHLHHCAWYVFKHSEDTVLMRDAVKWIDMLIEKAPEELRWMTMDTKACLLYKMGKKKDGISVMRKIIDMFPDQSVVFQSRLDCMLKDEDIWLKFQ